MAPSLDWTPLASAPADLHTRLNRLVFSIRKQLADLAAAPAPNLAAVEAAVTALELDAAATFAAVAAIESRLSADGSIFSMVGPLGAVAPVVAYDFTRYDPALTSAQNITAANLSGTAALDLTIVGSAQAGFLTLSGSAQSSPYAWTPVGASAEGGALFSGSGTDYAATTGSPAALQILGALTVEWLGYVTVIPGGTGDCYFFHFAGSGETEATNQLYGLIWVNTGTAWKANHETGAGVDSAASLLTSARTMFNDVRANPLHITLTRSAAGSAKLYFNGRLAAAAVTATPSALPTGGTSGNLSIGSGSDAAVRLATLGLRVFGAELTAAQVQESYRRTLFLE
jgi:hypothetical protein